MIIAICFIGFKVKDSKGNAEELTENNLDYKDTEVKYAGITDNFDFGEISFSDAARDPEIYSQFGKLYKSLLKEEVFTYIEVGNQHIEFRGHYDKKEEFVYGINRSKGQVINQKIEMKEETFYTTPIKAIQVGSSVDNYIGLNKYLDSGHYFDENDYDYKGGTIPLVLGNGYKSSYSVGDNIEFYYLFTKFDGKVIGILNEGTKVPVQQKEEIVDSYVLMPFFNINSEIETDFDLFDQVHTSQRTLGLIPYKTKKEFKKYSKKVEELSSIYKLPYTLMEDY